MSKLNKYINGNRSNVIYTILGFCKMIKEPGITYNTTKESIRYDNFIVLFDHRTCRIERFLVNSGIHKTSNPVQPGSTKGYGDIKTNHVDILEQKDSGEFAANKHDLLYADEESLYINITSKLFRFKDGKLSKDFISHFIFHIVYSNTIRNDICYSSIQDLRKIVYLRLQDPHKLKNDEIIADFLFPINYDIPVIIQANRSLVSKELTNHLDNILGIKLIGLSRKEQPPVIKDLIKFINGRVFINNPDLQRRVILFNNYVMKKINSG